MASRRKALETLRKEASLNGSEAAPILLTGEPGTGKTWLWRRFVQELPPRWGWLSLDMTGSLDVLEFHDLVGNGLGISPSERLSTARLALARALEEEWAEGRSWVLVIENAQNTPEPVWSEAGSIIHGMEASSGFALVILVGPGELARQLRMRARRSIACRLAAHVHLLPLDLEESRQIAECEWGVDSLGQAVLEELHRDAGGNPRRLRQLLRRSTGGYAPAALRSDSASPRKLPELPAREALSTVSPTVSNILPAAEALPAVERVVDQRRELAEPTGPPLVPSRPPLRVEEGLIEVGWEGSLEADQTADDDFEQTIETRNDETAVGTLAEGPPESALSSEESIEDHYAALQAWTEWARNRGRTTMPDDPESDAEAEVHSPEITADEVVSGEPGTRLHRRAACRISARAFTVQPALHKAAAVEVNGLLRAALPEKQTGQRKKILSCSCSVFLVLFAMPYPASRRENRALPSGRFLPRGSA